MTIAAEDLRKLDVDFTETTSLPLDYYFVIAKDGAIPLRVKGSTLLRSGLIYEVDVTGSGSGSISFADYNVIELTVSLDYVATLTNVPVNSRNLLIVLKPTTKQITFSGAYSVNYGRQQGLTKVYYDVTNVNGDLVITQLNNQSFVSISSTVLDPALPTDSVISFDHFNWTTEGIHCTVSASFTLSRGITLPTATIDLVGFTPVFYNDSEVIQIYAYNGTVMIPSIAVLSATQLIIYFDAINIGDIQIKLSGTFRIK